MNEGIQAIYCAEYRKIPPVSTALKFAEISHFNEGSNDSTKWQDKCKVTFISTSNCLWAISDNHSFNRELSKKLSNNLALHRSSCLNLPGEIGTPKRRVLAIKQYIEELKHLTYFTDFIIVHGVQRSQCCNLQGRWIQATYVINAAIPRESCEN